MTNTAILAEGLDKTFNPKSQSSTKALDGVTFDLPRNTVTGLIGPNGAGKTTLIRVLMGFISPDKGKVEIFGKSPGEVETKKLIGYQSDMPFREKRVTVARYMNLHSELMGVKNNHDQIRYLLEAFHITDASNKGLAELSKGMRQKIELAAAFLGDPSLVILDEPTSALDPPSVFVLRDFLQNQKRAGKTILFSSHNLTEVEKICDSVLFINAGKISAKYELENRESGFLEDAFQKYLKEENGQ